MLEVDALYEGFVDTLPIALRPIAVDLPHLLKLAPVGGMRFSQVFNHPVTLGAPILISEVFPSASMALVRAAAMAHMLAVIEAFGSDRVADEQVPCTPELLSLLERLREARDLALDRVLPGASLQAMLADATTDSAIAEERRLLSAVRPADLELYRRVSSRKQAVGIPASVALAKAAGASQKQIRQIELLLMGVWLGLQFEDDVVDWEDDWAQGGAWAVCLARLAGERTWDREPRSMTPELVRKAVHDCGALRTMLGLARRRYRAAWRHARALGAHALAVWAAEREARLRALIPLEARFAGYTVRARALRSWAAEMLA